MSRSLPRVIRVAVVNDYEVVVRGVAAMLEPVPDIDVVELVAGSVSLHPGVDVALYDTFGAPSAGLDTLHDVVVHPDVAAVVAYTSRHSEALVRRFLDAGAMGYVAKSSSAEDLADAIRRVHAGEVVVLDGVDANEGDDGTVGRWPGAQFGLTEREADTLALLVRGLDNKAIADELFVGPDAIKARLKSIYDKIGVGSRVSAAVWAVHHGFEQDRFVVWRS